MAKTTEVHGTKQSMRLSQSSRMQTLQLLERLSRQRVSYDDFHASWTTEDGMLDVASDGYETITTISNQFKSVEPWKTYPLEYLQKLVAHAYLKFPDDVAKVVDIVQEQLREYYARQRAFVPFFGLHLEHGVNLDFGRYRLSTLGKEGFEREIVAPFQQFRAAVGEEQFRGEVERLRKDLRYIPNVPILTVEYIGAAQGAEEVVAPIAEHVAEFLQFLVAWVVDRRDFVRIIDHRGEYFGNFMTPMPVLTRDIDSMEPWRLGSPNLRGYPYGPIVASEHLKVFAKEGFLDLTQSIAEGSYAGNGGTAILLRAIQLFSDGERAVSRRQAMVAYVGACEALFGKKDEAELYTCAGIAAASESDFERAFEEAEGLYTERSEAAHAGITPPTVDQARRVAMISIRYVSRNMSTLKNRKATRDWTKPHAERAREFRARRRPA